MKNTAILAALLTISSSCASTTIRDLKENDSSSGVIFYESSPYVMVKGGAATIVYLPNKERRRSIEWSAGLFGSAHPKFALEDGWNLTSFDTTVTSGASDGLEAITGIFAAAAFADTGSDEPDIARIYPLIWEGGDWKIGTPIAVKP